MYGSSKARCESTRCCLRVTSTSLIRRVDGRFVPEHPDTAGVRAASEVSADAVKMQKDGQHLSQLSTTDRRGDWYWRLPESFGLYIVNFSDTIRQCRQVNSNVNPRGTGQWLEP